MIRKVTTKDARAITNIYNYYVKNSIATLEENLVEVNYFIKKIEKTALLFPWLVYEIDNEIIGYAYAGKWNVRSAYNRTVEVSIYLKEGVTQKGLGSLLYNELIKELKKQNYHVLIGGISLPNIASVKLHEKFGFEKVAHFKQVGYKFNTWVDVGYWQLTLNK